MYNRIKHENHFDMTAEYVVVGGGPAAICAIAKLYGSQVPGNTIVWVDTEFKVGDFGTKLSIGSSVPGNTAVENYQKVNNAIYAMVPACAPTKEEKEKFEMTTLSPEITCSLRVAREPLQHITEKLRRLVHSIKGSVLEINETKDGIQLQIESENNTKKYVLTKRVVLAVGAKSKTVFLPNHITLINPNVAFIQSELNHYLNQAQTIKKVAVVGSSHSAALATMHLLQAGIPVKQFMNKEYKFATTTIAPDGTTYTQFDNTGLKGSVATFTQQLLNDKKMREIWECHTGKDTNQLLTSYSSDCTHAVVCIGYTPSCSLKINGAPLSAFKYDVHSTQIMRLDGTPVAGIFGIGVAFPLETKSISGEVEFAVGVGKFWASINQKILTEWKNHPAGLLLHHKAIAQHAIQRYGIFQNSSQQEHYNEPRPIQAKAKL